MFVESFTTIRQRGARLLTAASAAMAIAGATPLRAQAPAPTPAQAPAPAAAATPITIDQAIQIALRQNGTLLQAKNAAALSAATVQQQKLQFLPNLEVSASTAQSYGGGSVAGLSSDQSSRSLSAGVSSSLTLFDGLKNVAQLKGAQLTSRASENDLTRAKQTVVYTVASNFIDLGKQAEQLRIQQQNLAAQEAQQREIEAYVNAGTRPISDLYQQQATVASTRAAVEQGDGDAEPDRCASSLVELVPEARVAAAVERTAVPGRERHGGPPGGGRRANVLLCRVDARLLRTQVGALRERP